MTSTFDCTSLFADRVKRIPVHGFKGSMPSYIVPLAFGLPDPGSFPLDGLASTTSAMLRTEGPSALQYGPVTGHPALLELIRGKLAEREGLSVTMDNLMLTNGSTQALELVARLFIDPGQMLLVEAPTFLGAVRVFHTCDVKTDSVPLDGNGIRVDLLDSKITELKAKGQPPKVVYVMPNFHNPAGVTMPLANRIALLEVAAKHGIVVLEDDAYGDLRYEGTPLPSLYSLDKAELVIRIGTFSKILAAGMRLGWAVGSKEVMSKLSACKLDTGTNPFGAHAAAAFWQAGLLYPHIDELIEVYRAKRDAMLSALEEFCPPEGKWTTPEGGFFIWLELPEHVDTGALLPQAVEEGVTYLPGEACFDDGSGKNFIRLSFSYPSNDEIREGIRRLSNVLKKAI